MSSRCKYEQRKINSIEIKEKKYIVFGFIYGNFAEWAELLLVNDFFLSNISFVNIISSYVFFNFLVFFLFYYIFLFLFHKVFSHRLHFLIFMRVRDVDAHPSNLSYPHFSQWVFSPHICACLSRCWRSQPSTIFLTRKVLLPSLMMLAVKVFWISVLSAW